MTSMKLAAYGFKRKCHIWILKYNETKFKYRSGSNYTNRIVEKHHLFEGENKPKIILIHGTDDVVHKHIY